MLRYKIQPKEAETLEPQQALILKVADKALQDAGIDERKIAPVRLRMRRLRAQARLTAAQGSSDVDEMEQAIIEAKAAGVDESQLAPICEKKIESEAHPSRGQIEDR